jgi:phosphoglycerate dehydrogenase-like enzyme
VSKPGFHPPVEHPGRVLVMGASAEEPPPGIVSIEGVVDVSFANDDSELATALPGTDVLFAWRPRSSWLEPVWERAGDLRWIQSASAGIERLLFPGLVESQVVLTNARGVFDEAMAEYVVALMLLFSKGLLGVLERQRRHEWEHRDTETLQGKRALIVGVGSIGRAIGRRCGELGLLVKGVGTTARPGDDVFRSIAGADELADAVGWADFVIDVLPGTPTTTHVFDVGVFGGMKPTTRFINVGRGSTVDEDALVEAVRDGRLAGAALDVFEDEPLPSGHPLWDLPNVVVSPHMSGDFAGWRETVVELFVDNLRRYLTGEPLRNVVDKTRGYVPS